MRSSTEFNYEHFPPHCRQRVKPANRSAGISLWVQLICGFICIFGCRKLHEKFKQTKVELAVNTEEQRVVSRGQVGLKARVITFERLIAQ